MANTLEWLQTTRKDSTPPASQDDGGPYGYDTQRSLQLAPNLALTLSAKEENVIQVNAEGPEPNTDKLPLVPIEQTTHKKAPLAFWIFGQTDVGVVRENNEDSFVLSNLDATEADLKAEHKVHSGERGLLLGVFDGMGGSAAGEVASRMAVELVGETLANEEPIPQDALARGKALVHALDRAHDVIFRTSREQTQCWGMGCTATLASIRDRSLLTAQVGDSRAYLWRKGKLIQLTRDQTLVAQLVAHGAMTEEEARMCPVSNVILQALGSASGEKLLVDVTEIELKRGDRILVCSDGLHGQVEDEDIGRMLGNAPSPQDACQLLIDASNAEGGKDNVTCVIAFVLTEESKATIPPQNQNTTSMIPVAPHTIPVPRPQAMADDSVNNSYLNMTSEEAHRLAAEIHQIQQEESEKQSSTRSRGLLFWLLLLVVFVAAAALAMLTK